MVKKLLLTGAALALLAVGVTTFGGSMMAANAHPVDITGVWEVDADAPYRPHLFTFHTDGTMTTTNPTNVQENLAQPQGGTNDSLGMGVWRVENNHGHRYIVGTFEQLNAFARTHQPTDKLSVSFKVQLADNGKGFDGPAVARVGSNTAPSHLTGVRMTVDEAAVDSL